MTEDIQKRFMSLRAKHLTAIAVIVTMIGLTPYSAQAECNKAEVGYIAVFDVKPGSEAAFETAITKLAETVQRVEPGVILYAPYKGAGEKYYMMERYKDEAARKVHASSDEVKALFGPLMSTLAGPADIQPINAVCS